MVNENESSATAALDLARRGFAVFPVHYVKADGTCSCGDRTAGTRQAPVDGERVQGRQHRSGSGRANVSRIPIVGKYRRGDGSRMRDLGSRRRGGGTADPRSVGSSSTAPCRRRSPRSPAAAVGTYGFKWNGIEIRNRTKIDGQADRLPGSRRLRRRPAEQPQERTAVSVGARSRTTTPIAEAPSWLLDLVVGTSGKLA